MKTSSVLVVLDAPMRFLPPDVKHALNGFLFHWCKGMSPEHAGRWQRLWRRLYHSKEQRPTLQLWVDVDRSLPYHQRWMAIETRLYEQQDGFYNLGGLRNWLKTGAAFGTYSHWEGRLIFVPSSLSWEDCSDDEMREFTDNAIAYLRTPHALATLWPVVAEADRAAMLEACLADPQPEEGPHHG